MKNKTSKLTPSSDVSRAGTCKAFEETGARLSTTLLLDDIVDLGDYSLSPLLPGIVNEYRVLLSR